MTLKRLPLILCLAVFAVTAHAQYRAGIQGVVTDPVGAVVPEATVTLTSNETNISRTAKTSEGGVYSFSSLAPGAFRLTVEKVGFSKKVLEDVRVRGEQMQSLNVELAVGQISDTVTVTEVVPLIDSQTATIGGTLTSKEVAQLPSFGRDPLTLVRLTLGAFGDGARSASGGSANLPSVNRPANGAVDSIFREEGAPQAVINGARQASTNIRIDGVSVNSVSWAGSAVVTPNEESIKEIVVVSNNYSAEAGASSGAQVQFVSKNGTNQFHGSGFFKFHRPGLNAYQAWNGISMPTDGSKPILTPVQRDTNRFNQLGGSMGGPILKNRLFAFFSWEGVRNRSFGIANNWFETQQYRDSVGKAGGPIAKKMLSYPGQNPFSTRVLPNNCASINAAPTQCHDVAGGIDVGSPLITPIGTKDPTWSGSVAGTGNGFDGIPDFVYIQTATPNVNRGDQYNGRLDFRLSDKDSFGFSIYWVPGTDHNINGPARSLNQWNKETLRRSWTVIGTHAFSPTMLNEARFGFSGWRFSELDSNPQEPWGLPVSNINGTANVPGAPQLGPNGPGQFDQATRNVRDTLSKVHNSHSLKFGGELTRARFVDAAPWQARPTYAFHNLWDYANDAPYQEGGAFDPVTGQPTLSEKHMGYTNVGLFVQDDWKVKPNLTLNLGLRWEYYSPLTEQHGLVSNIVLGQGTAALTGLKIKNGGGLQSTSKRNFGPQVGMAWSPKPFNNKLVLRGGFGMGFNVQKLATTGDYRFNPPYVVNLNSTATGDIVYAVPSDVKQFTNWPVNPVTKQTFNSTTGLPVLQAPAAGQLFSPGALGLTGFQSPQPSPTTYRYSIDAQYELGHNWAATLGYQGSQSRNFSRRVPLNWLNYPNLNPAVSGMTFQYNDAASHYNALLAQVQHRFSTSFQIDAQYRLSRLIDQGSEDYYQDAYPFDIKYSTGPADYDVTHDFRVWGVWTPTIFKGSRGWLEKIVGGWTISGMFDTHSGFPWGPTYNTRTNNNVIYPNSGLNNLPPNQYKGGATNNYSNGTFMSPNGNFPNGAPTYFALPTFSTSAIPPPPAGSYRNIFRGPRYRGFDGMLAKSFGFPKLGEGVKLNLQANMYNAFNTLNLNRTPRNNIALANGNADPQFGSVSGALGGRIVELQAKLVF